MIKHFVFILLAVCFTASKTLCQVKVSTPYELVLVAYDTQIENGSASLVSVMTSREIEIGYRIGITNNISDDNNWYTYNDSPNVTLEFVYNGGLKIEKGTVLNFELYPESVSIISNDVDVTSLFTMENKGSYPYNFLKQGAGFVTLYSGYFIPEKESMLGIVLDVFPVGIPHQKLANILLPESVANKNIIRDVKTGPTEGFIPFDKDCILCEMLEEILDVSNWTIIEGNKNASFNYKVFDYIECEKDTCATGTLKFETVNCNDINITSNPCNGKAIDYEIQQLIDGQFVTIQSGSSNLAGIPPLPSNGTFQLIFTCVNGCEYTSVNIETIDCLEPNCMASVTIDGECEMTALVVGCNNPMFQWYKATNGPSGMPIFGANTSTFTSLDNETYYVEISGCDGCETVRSEYVTGSSCIPTCDCDFTFTSDGCLITFTEENCDEVFTFWQYRTDESSPWQNITNVTSPLIAENHNGNGEYRWNSFSDYCSDSEIIPIDCPEVCEPSVHVYQDQDCNLVAEWSNCKFYAGFNWTLNPNCEVTEESLYGGEILSATIGNGSGTVVFGPDLPEGCYVFTLDCGKECYVTPTLIKLDGTCCPSGLAIENNDCVFSTNAIPCSPLLYYTWIHGGLSTSGTLINGNVPPYTSTENESVQLVISCEDGCTFNSNVLSEDCSDNNDCNFSISLEVQGCLLLAYVDGCDEFELIWYEKILGQYQVISGVTGSTYQTDGTGDYKVELAYCDDCEISDTYAEENVSDCGDCNCDILLENVADCSIITASDFECESIIETRWYQLDENDNWIEIIEALNESNLQIEENGTYRRIITLAGCDEEFADIEIECFEDCSNIIELDFSLDDNCNLVANWTGCDDFIGGYWTFIPSYWITGTCEDQTSGPSMYISPTEIVDSGTNPDGTGYSILSPPNGPGCYKFSLRCGNCEVVRETESWEYCCDGVCTPEIIFDNVTCSIDFVSEADEACHQSLIQQDYIPIYKVDTGNGFVTIGSGTFFNALYEGNYQITYTHPYCEDVISNIENVYDLQNCEFNGNFEYDCISGINNMNISGGSPPYSLTWFEASGSFYENMNGTSVDLGFIFPSGASGDIIVTDSQGNTILMHENIVDCTCEFTFYEDTRYDWVVLRYQILMGGVLYEASDTWSDDPDCAAANTSEDLENEIYDILNSNCNSLFDPSVDIQIGNGIFATICIDKYCDIEFINFQYDRCTDQSFMTTNSDLAKDCIGGCSSGNQSMVRNESNNSAPIYRKVLDSDLDQFTLDKSVSIAPNPAINKTTIKLTGSLSEKYTVQLLAADGSQVFTKSDKLSKTGNRLLPIDVGQMQSGVYFLKVQIGEKYIATKKLVVVK